MASSLKQLKEQFVSDLTGGSIEEIYNVTGIALSAYLSYRMLKKTFGDLSIVYDFICNVLTLLVATTSYSNNPTYLHYFIVIPSLVIYVFNYYVEPRDATKTKADSGDNTQEFLPKKQFITAYRSQMLIVTNLAILAVDFRIFPRRFAKVETWGTSMMDLGVGSFVFSMGLANSRQLIKNYTGKYTFSLYNYLTSIKRNVIKSVPILVLGVIRLISVKGLEYQEHETEYGIHWNFFFTLGFLPTFLAILDPLLNLLPRFITALGISLGCEILLSRADLLRFILSSDNRMESLITMNKEGIFSFIGYLSIFIIGQSFGLFVLTSYTTKNNLISISKTKISKKKESTLLSVTTTQGLVIASVFYQLLFNFVNGSDYFATISRRLANLPYVLWVVSYNAVFLLGYDLIDKIIPGDQSSAVLDSINNNGLFIFLLGNLLTGLVNMSLNTLEASNTVATLVLIAYSLVWTVAALWLNKNKIYIKL
ncbi:GPI-anchored wall transfer protein 1 [Candida viswanathii]|uniref:GPI-anchored wall transfer protein n=1 Tax=Candida viswanathii TaxID=5486 RepID=A0A367YLW6_9ASCO|nr:GPI-anchored wall transfer protein 1 [Candida viswanathii]